MLWIGKINKEGTGITFDKPLIRARFADWAIKNKGKNVRIEPDEKVSYKARGFFEGGVIPAYALWSDNYDHKNKDDLLEIRNFLKTKFYSKNFVEPDGTITKIVGSTTEMTNNEFTNTFIDKISDYFMKNFIPFPDVELYKKWRDIYSIKTPEYLTFIDWLDANGLEVDGGGKD